MTTIGSILSFPNVLLAHMRILLMNFTPAIPLFATSTLRMTLSPPVFSTNRSRICALISDSLNPLLCLCKDLRFSAKGGNVEREFLDWTSMLPVILLHVPLLHVMKTPRQFRHLPLMYRRTWNEASRMMRWPKFPSVPPSFSSLVRILSSSFDPFLECRIHLCPRLVLPIPSKFSKSSTHFFLFSIAMDHGLPLGRWAEMDAQGRSLEAPQVESEDAPGHFLESRTSFTRTKDLHAAYATAFDRRKVRCTHERAPCCRNASRMASFLLLPLEDKGVHLEKQGASERSIRTSKGEKKGAAGRKGVAVPTSTSHRTKRKFDRMKSRKITVQKEQDPV